MSNPSGAARRRAFLFFGISVLVAGGTAFLMQRIVSGYEARIAQAREASADVAVVTAARDLPAGVALTAADLQTTSVPASVAREGSTYASVEELVGKVPRERVLAGEALRRERLESGEVVSQLAITIADGWRAAAVRVDRARGVAGLLEPGNRVDVIVTIRPDDNSLGANWVTETILQDVRVLAVGPSVYGFEPAAEEGLEKRETDSNTRWALVTLEVLPEEAEKLALADSRGDLALALRRPGDQDLMENTGPTVTNALLGISTGTTQRAPTRRRVQPARTTPPESPKSTLEVIQGSKTSVQTFDAEGRRINDKAR